MSDKTIEPRKKSKFMRAIKSNVLPWAIIILAVYGTGMYLAGWYNRSNDNAQFSALSTQIQDLKAVK